MAVTTADSGSERILPEGLVDSLRNAGVRIKGGILLALGLALAFALLTYDSSDPAANVAAAGPTANILGGGGAHVADWLLRCLGFTAALFAATPVAWGCRALALKRTRRVRLRLLALVLALPCLAVALAVADIPGWPLEEGLGGAFGKIMLLHAAPLFGGSDWVIPTGGLILGLGLAGFAVGLDRNDWASVGAAALAAARWAAGAARIRRIDIRRLRLPNPSDLLRRPTLRRPRLPKVPSMRRDGGSHRRKRNGRPSLGLAAQRGAGPADPGISGPAEAEPVAAPAEEAETETPQPEHTRKKRPVRQHSLPLDESYVPPPVGIMQMPPDQAADDLPDAEALERNAALLVSVLGDFGVNGEVLAVHPGPVVTLYEFEPQAGIKSSRVIGLADDIARYMSAVSVRVAVVPGRTAIGIEMPNRIRQTVYMRELLEAEAFEQTKASLALILGKDIGGTPQIAELERMPHLLIAGTTGSGKSVAINTMILSLLYRLPPEQCRLIMVDPKMLELSVYEGIPHLLAPVVTDPRKAVTALKWTVREMENRYRAMSALGVRNIGGYNTRITDAIRKGETLTRRVQTGHDPETDLPEFEDQPLDMRPFPYIVVVIDELADLMLVAKNDIETAIQRLAQMARAAGIHLLMATQRPSVDVITGTIKANFPTRISFQVTSKIDSRTILGEGGAEQLLGQGDMLFMAGGGRITRMHGPFVTDGEVEEVVTHLKAQGEPDYLDAITEDEEVAAGIPGFGETEVESTGDDLYDRAVAFVARERKVSVSLVQRHLRIGYNRAARIVEQMESEGVISPANHQNKREVLVGGHDG